MCTSETGIEFFQMKMTIATINAKGKKNYMNDADRADKVSSIRQEIALNCN
jgi:hypothetical protein